MGLAAPWRTGLAEGTDRVAGCSPCQQGDVLLTARGERDAPGKRQSMHLAVFPKHPLLAVSASCTCRCTALGSRSAEELTLVKDFPFSPASIVPSLSPHRAAAYFQKESGNEPFAPSEPCCIPSPHCPDLHINVLSLVG